jgi:acyl carrier protein
VIETSRLRVTIDHIAEDEPLNRPLLTVTSFGSVGMLLRLEDELDTALPEDMFVGRSFTTVGDLVDTVMESAA